MVADLEGCPRYASHALHPSGRLPGHGIERGIRRTNLHDNVRTRIQQTFKITFDGDSPLRWLEEGCISMVCARRTGRQDKELENRENHASHVASYDSES